VRILAVVVALAGCSSPAPSHPTSPPSTPIAATTNGTHRAPPPAQRRVVTDTYHGVAVPDPYQWLEADTPEVGAWSEAQNVHARGYLDALPHRDELRKEIEAIVTAPVTRYFDLHPAGKKLFVMRKDPKREQSELIVADGPDGLDRAKVVLDPAQRFDSHHAIDWFAPSPDGSRVAISISAGGSENGTLYIVDLDGKDVDTPIPDVQRGTGGGHAAWRPDGKALYYTRYPAKGERPDGETDFWQTLWSHELGAPRDKDKRELGDGFPRIAEVELTGDERGRVIATVQDGDSGRFRHYLRDAKGTWRQLDDFDDGITFVGFGPTNDLWLVSKKDAPKGKVLRLPSTTTNLAQAKVVIPEAEPIETDFYANKGLTVTNDYVYVAYQVGGPSELRAFTLAGKRVELPQLPPVASVGYPIPWGSSVLVTATTYTKPRTWYRLDPGKHALDALPISETSPVSLDDWEVRREFADSSDGAKVPINIIWKRGAPQDGRVPCLVTGYGGFRSSVEPGFLDGQAPLLRRGLCFVVANLRGGNEFGEDWHKAGMLLVKQHVFDDLAATLRHLVAKKYSSPEHLAIRGGSNGGLLMGALLTQHPELVRVVISQVGIYDMLRCERSSNGQFNVAEYGSVTDPDQFKAMYAYSPYHHVVAGTKYPATLMTTGANDPRVPPWHSRKMIAALQAAQAGGQPILLRTSSTSGHGIGTSMTERIDLATDIDAFLLHELGL
jgi:prolyl oligopeptidase